jgi:ribosomal protein S8
MNKLYLMLNFIKGAQIAGQNYIIFSYSNNSYSILNLLYKEGYIKGFLIQKKVFWILLKYKYDKPVITKICVWFLGSTFPKKIDLFKISNGLCSNVVSTFKDTSNCLFFVNIKGVLLFSIS